MQTHLVCHVPPYHPADAEPLKQPRDVQIVIHSNGRTSEPVPFTYFPGTLLTVALITLWLILFMCACISGWETTAVTAIIQDSLC